MRTIRFDRRPESLNKEGVYSYMADCPVKLPYPGNIALKIFKDEFAPLETFQWNQVNFLDASKIQNILWMEGLAPRVYEIVTVDINGEKHWGQLTDLIPEEKRGPMLPEVGLKLLDVLKRFGITRTSIDPNKNHQYIDQRVDMSHYYFHGDTYKNVVIEMVNKQAGWGSNPRTYQGVSELGIEGQRDLAARLPVYQFDKIDFQGKTVLDYGGSSGHMGRECLDRGASRVVSLDLEAVSQAGQHLSNYLGYFNIDFYGGNFRHDHDVYSEIKSLTGLNQFDVVLYLSCQQLLMPDYLDQIVGEVFILEGHVPDKEITYRPVLEKAFREVNFVGATRDHGPRPVFICKK